MKCPKNILTLNERAKKTLLVTDNNLEFVRCFRYRKHTKRLFGSKSNQIADDQGRLIEANNSIILYPKNFLFTPSIGKPVFILVNSSSLDSNFIEVEKNEIAYYRKTIYFKRGNFQVRFLNEEDKNIFLATLSINLETKTLNKYNVEFNFPANKQNILHIHSPTDIFDLKPNIQLNETANEDQLYFDKAFNQIKGLIYGLVCSTIGKKTSVQIKLEKSLQNLKSKISGFRTRLEMSDEFSSEMITPLVEKVDEVKAEAQDGYDYSSDKAKAAYYEAKVKTKDAYNDASERFEGAYDEAADKTKAAYYDAKVKAKDAYEDAVKE